MIGERSNLPTKLQELIYEAEIKTLDNKLNIILAFNYGFKSELYTVIKKVYNDSKKNINFSNKDLDLNLNKLFYLGDIPDPDILIRTGGYKRLSNYIMYNLCYTELFFRNFMA